MVKRAEERVKGHIRNLERGVVVLPLQLIRKDATQTTSIEGGEIHLRSDLLSNVGDVAM